MLSRRSRFDRRSEPFSIASAMAIRSLVDSGGPATRTGRVVPPDAFCNHSTEKLVNRARLKELGS